MSLSVLLLVTTAEYVNQICIESKRCKVSFYFLVGLDSSTDFCVQRCIAEMMAVRKPFSSNTATASIVVPPGEQTISFKAPFLQSLIQLELRIYRLDFLAYHLVQQHLPSLL